MSVWRDHFNVAKQMKQLHTHNQQPSNKNKLADANL